MDEYKDIVPQCAVCKSVKGKRCKAFDTDIRDAKYYDSQHEDFSRCDKFELNESAPKVEKFKELSKGYNWK